MISPVSCAAQFLPKAAVRAALEPPPSRQPILSGVASPAIATSHWVRFGDHPHHTLRVMTYNLEMLHEADNPFPWHTKTAASRQALAQVIANSNVDLALVQEVESTKVLDQFVTDDLNPLLVSQKKAPYRAVAFDPLPRDNPAGKMPIAQGFLYREPLSLIKTETVTNQNLAPTAEPLLSRPLLLGHFEIALPDGRNQPLLVANVHLKANGQSFIGSRTMKEFVTACLRLRECYGVQQALGQAIEGYGRRGQGQPWVLLGGDFNTDPKMGSSPAVLGTLLGQAQRPAHRLYDFETDQVISPEQPVAFERFRLHDGSPPVPLTQISQTEPTRFYGYYNDPRHGGPRPDRQIDYLLANEALIQQTQPKPIFLRATKDKDVEKQFRLASDHDPATVELRLGSHRPLSRLA